MGLLKFKTQDVKRVVSHALNSPNHHIPFDVIPNQPAILIVHDHGVYLMSNGTPCDKEGDKNHVVYAQGCNPNTDEDFYEESRYKVGGDDFAEPFPVTAGTLQRCDQYEELHIRMNSKSISVTFKKPKK